MNPFDASRDLVKQGRYYGADKDSTECYKVEVTGNTATYTDKDGTGSRYEILKGNPKGL